MKEVMIKVIDNDDGLALTSFQTSADEEGLDSQELEILSEKVAESIQFEMENE